jgi:hypothetical protein
VGWRRPHFSPLSRGEKTAGSLQPTRSPRSVSRGEGELGCCWPSREVTSFSRSTAASPGKSATNAESCSVRFVSRGTADRKCTALANVGVMLTGLRPSGQAARANTKTDSERRAQKRDSSGHIGWHPNVEKTVRIPSETKSLQRQELPLSYLGTPGPAEPLSSSWRTVNGDRAKTCVADASATEHETLRKHFSNPRMQKRRMDYVGSQGPTKTTKECHSANSR